MRTLGALRGRYDNQRAKAKAEGKDYATVRLTLREELLAYFQSDVGKEHIAESLHAGKDPEWLAEQVLKSVDGWERVEERLERERPVPPVARPYPTKPTPPTPPKGGVSK